MSSGKNNLRIVLDTNVYISALLFGGIPAEIIELAREKKVALVASPPILLEFARVLQEKFKYPRKTALNVVLEIKRISTIVVPDFKVDLIKEDTSDNKIIECALKGEADYIVTGDKKHLRPLNEYKKIKIRLPKEFIKEAKF